MRSGVLLSALFLAGAAPLAAQDKVEKIPPAAQAAEKAEPPTAPRQERDGTSTFVYYLLVALAAVAILTAICVPIRRD